MTARLLLGTALCRALAVCVCVLPAAHASVVSFQTRNGTSVGGAVDAAGYQSAVEALMAVAPTAGYCDASPALWDGVSNQGTCSGSFTDVAYDIRATFGVSAAQAGTWGFRVGPDFGFGGALFVDGVAVDFRSAGMWWDGSYADPTQILAGSVVLGAGNHTIEAYGVEGCCDGPQQAQFLAPGADGFVTFGAEDGLDPVSVPEPSTVALLGLALAGLAAAGRRRSGLVS